MPTIGGRNFPYTSEGMRAANLYQQQLAQNPGTRGGGLPGYMGFRPLGMQRGGMLDIEIPTNQLLYNKLLEVWGQVSKMEGQPLGQPPSMEEWNKMPKLQQEGIVAQLTSIVEDSRDEIARKASEQRRRGSLPSSVGLGQPPFSAEAEGRGLGQQPRSEQPLFMQPGMGVRDSENNPAWMQHFPGPVGEPVYGLRHGGMLPRRRRY